MGRKKSGITVRVSRLFLNKPKDISRSIYIRRLVCGRLGSTTTHLLESTTLTDGPSTSNTVPSINEPLHQSAESMPNLDDFNIGIDDFDDGPDDRGDQEAQLNQPKIKVRTLLIYNHDLIQTSHSVSSHR
jgi:hypothetical protein